MKRTLLLLLAISVVTIKALATIHTVNVADFQFTPSSLNMTLGDTIKWVWVSGTHTSTSSTIPSGAATWNASINSSSTTFMYKPTVTGTYNYVCTFHTSMGMNGAFTVTSGSTGVSPVTFTSGVSMYPNPATSTVHLLFDGNGEAAVNLFDITGRAVFSNVYNSREVLLNVEDIPNGVYYVTVTRETSVYKHEVLVVH